MCSSCSGSNKVRSSLSKSCQKSGADLTDSRNKLVTLFNLEKDLDKKSSYKSDRLEIDSILKSIANTGVCPDRNLVVEIKIKVDNEYSKYNNS